MSSKYGTLKQKAEYNNSPPIGKDKQKEVQQINDTFLWYAQGVESKIHKALSLLATQQSIPSQNTMKQSEQLFKFLAKQQPEILLHHKSDMI